MRMLTGLENTGLHTRLFRLFFCDALCDALRFAFLDDQRFGLLDHRSLDTSSDLCDFVCSWE